MTRKPASLQYGVEEIPPASVIVVNALQYVAVLAGFLVFPLIMTREAHASPAVADSVLSWSMIVLAIGTIAAGAAERTGRQRLPRAQRDDGGVCQPVAGSRSGSAAWR